MDFISQLVAVFQKGGPVMYLILACSIVVIAIAIERFVFYRQAQTDVETLLQALSPKLESGDWQGAIKVCESIPGIIPGVLVKGLRCNNRSRHSLEHTLEGAASLAASNLREHLSYLDMIVTLAPLLGLLGTVVGMINSFSVMSIRAGQPLAITGGVGEALVATASGLCVAVVALVVHSYFSHRLDQTITDLEQACTFLLDASDCRGEGHETA